MIVKPAVSESGRTVWTFELEPDDRTVPRSTLWIDGLLHQTSADIEAIWLAVSLGPFAGKRLVVPRHATRAVCEILEAAVGVSLVAAEPERNKDRSFAREFSAALIRDPLDHYLSDMAREPAQFAIEIHPDPGRFGYGSSAFRIAHNAGTLRRHMRPLDGIGEFAALWMLSPMLSLGHLTAFLCSEELADIGAVTLAQLAQATGLTLRLPLAGVGIGALGRTLPALGLPPISCFRGLWNRYRMFPALMGAIYREMEPFLDAAEPDPAIRISRYMAQAHTNRIAAIPAAFDEAFFARPMGGERSQPLAP